MTADLITRDDLNRALAALEERIRSRAVYPKHADLHNAGGRDRIAAASTHAHTKIEDSDGNTKVDVGTSDRRDTTIAGNLLERLAAAGLQYADGLDLMGYSDEFTTQTWHLDGADARLVLGADYDGRQIALAGSTSVAKLAVRVSGIAETAGLVFSMHSGTLPSVLGPILTLAKSKGSYASQTAVGSGDLLGGIEFLGHDGTDYERSAAIYANVDTTPGDGDMPGRLSFWTTPDGSATLRERFRLDSSGVWVMKESRERWQLTAKTIASDQVAIAANDSGHWTLAGQGAAADDLDGITGGTQGDILILSPVSDSVTITLKHNNAGGSSGAKLFLAGAADVALDDINDCVMLIYKTALDSGNGGWMQIGGSGGSGSLTVEEEDGAPSVASVTKIQVTNGKLTDDGGGTVSLDLSGGGAATNEAMKRSTSQYTINTAGFSGYADIDATNLSISLTLTQASRVMLMYQCPDANGSGTPFLNLRFTVDGAASSPANFFSWQFGGDFDRFAISIMLVTDVLTAGAHTFRVQAKTSANSVVLNGDSLLNGGPHTFYARELNITS